MTRLNCCKAGSILLKLFLVFTCLFGALYLYDLLSEPFGFSEWSVNKAAFIVKAILAVLFCSLLFWSGIILTYTCCNQLRLKKRILGIIFAWIPVLNIIMLVDIIVTADEEYSFEKEKYKLNLSRKNQRICRTKYPILLVHGVFFRDFRHLNYWGRIPGELEANGAVIYYGEHNSASSVRDSAEQLKARILSIIRDTGCEKVNIIAHSKGGLDVRYMLSDPEAEGFIASLTTINTPHRGCRFADYLFGKVPRKQQEQIAKLYNSAASKLGDKDPDFLEAAKDLTYDRCRQLNELLHDPEHVFCQSTGSIQKRATYGRFPLNLTHRFVKYFDGENDGLVGADSFEWGSSYTLLRPNRKRGISHGDMIDLNRENIKGFDVREFYVQLVADLKNRGF